MSMHRLSAGAGYQYLLKHTACGDIDRPAGQSLTAYYTESGYPPGRWTGTGLAGLAPAGVEPPVLVDGAVVTEEAMARLFGNGHHPTTGEPLGRPYPTFKTATERINDAVAKLPATMGALERQRAIEMIKKVETAKPVRAAVAGFDMTFTAPKSASTLWALAKPEAQHAVLAAHRQAVDQALAYLEDRFLHTRVGARSCAQVPTRGMIAAAFDHWDTRAGDPNLHTHVVVANKVQGPDGLWRSLDSRALHHAVVAVSEVYDNLFADALTRHLPVAWVYRDRGERRTPAYEVDGVHEDLLSEFSTRSTKIDEAMTGVLADFRTRHGRGPNRVEILRLRQQVTRATRPAKTVRPLRELFAAWRDRAHKRTGQHPDVLADAALQPRPGTPQTAAQVPAATVEAIGREVLAAVMTRRSTWTRVNLLAETARATRTLRMATPADRHELHHRVVTSALDQCVSLEAPELFTVPAEYRRADGASVFDRPDEARYTSTAVLDAETRLLTATNDTTAPTARASATTLSDQDPDGHLDNAAQPPDRGRVRLAADQAAAVASIATSGRRIDVLVGPAGTGKTTTLAGLRRVWETTQGAGSVIGLAPSATAAAELAGALGIACENTAKWLHESVGPGHARRTERLARLTEQRAQTRRETHPARAQALDAALAHLHAEDRRWRLGRGQLLIVDEASLAGTFALDTLTTQAKDAGAKVLLVGDHAQLSAVDAGGAFNLLAERGRPAVLTSLWRFRHQWEATATTGLRTGNPRALDDYDAHARITAGPAEAMLEDAYTAWQTDQRNQVPSILLAADATTVTALNTRAHNDRVTDGLVTPTGVTHPDGTVIGVGDRILTKRNDRTLTAGDGAFVRNGDLWDVTATHDDGTVTVARTTRDDDATRRAEVRLPAQYVREHVDLGYAATTHRAQGTTVKSAHLLAAPGMTREALYVGMTRGRESNRVYVAIDRLDPACDNMPDPHHVPTGRDVLEHILTTTGAELSATQTHARALDHAGSLHRLDPIRATLAADAAARHWHALLPECGLTAGQVEAIAASAKRAGIFAALTRGHESGHDMPAVLARLVADAPPEEDPAGVLHEQVTAWLDARTADPRSRPESPRTAGLVDPGDVAAPVLAEVDDLIRHRISALTQLAVLERPSWLAVRGPEPEAGAEREEWLAQIAASVARLDLADPGTRTPALNLSSAPQDATFDDTQRTVTR